MITSLLRSTSIFAALGALLVSGCGGLTCGEGTAQQDGACVIDGAGGESALGFEFAGAQAAGPASATSVLVAWLPASEPEALYNVYVSTSAKGFNFSEPQAVAPAGSTTAVIAGLEEDTNYFIVVRAELDGAEQPSDTPVEVTTADDIKPPDFAGAASADGKPGGIIELEWEKATDDLSPEGVLMYFVYAGTDAKDVDIDTPIGVSDPGATSVRVVMPKPETEYSLVVRVRDAAGNFDANEKTVKATSGADVDAPVFSGCKTAAGKTASSLVVSWNAAEDDIAAEEDIVNQVFAATEAGGFNFEAPDAVVTGETTAIVPGLGRDTSYFVVCRAVDPSDNSDDNMRLQSAKTKADDVAPDFDGVVVVDNVTTFTADLSWTPATDNLSKPKNIVYDVFLSETSGEFDLESKPFATSPPGASGLTLTELSSNTNYYLIVLARDEGENRSAVGNEAVVAMRVSFAVDVYSLIVVNSCPDCHGGGEVIYANLDMSSAEATYSGWVNVDAASELGAGFKRIVPGDPSISHVMDRLKGTGPVINVGDRMPLSGTYLDDITEIPTLETWILQGAENN